MVEPKAVNEVKASIEKMGMKNPIVVLMTTAKAWRKEKSKYPFILDPPDIKGGIFQIRFGHNRVAAMKELKYSYVPCIVCKTVEEAAEIGKEQAKWQKQKLGPL